MARQIETYRGFVYPWSMDHVGHMNVQFYVGRFDEASWHFLAQLGLTPSFLSQNRRSLVALDQRTQYKLEVLSGSLLHIHSELLELKSKTIRYQHSMKNSETGLEVASMELLVGYLDIDARKTTPLPAQVQELANAMQIERDGAIR
jgi:acyl-CoA thioester hydrolase